jgi:hypothetical protein
METEVKDAVDNGEDRTPPRVARAVEANKFAPDAIFLVGEFKGSGGGRADIRFGGSPYIEALGAADKVNIT